MTTDQLNRLSKKDLTDKAKKLSVERFDKLGKDDLVKAVQKAMAAKKDKPAAKPAAVKPLLNGHAVKPAVPVKAKSAKSVSRMGESANGQATAAKGKFDMGLAARELANKQKMLQAGATKDRIVLMVRDPFWLHVYWELTHQAVQRAEAALGQDWHGARPILRVCDVSAQDTTSTAEAVIKDIQIHGGCSNWYIEVPQPPKSYRVDIGYQSKRGQFYALARSNVVNTPKAGASDSIDETWSEADAKNADRLMGASLGGFDIAGSLSGANSELKSLIEERLRKPLSSPSLSSYASAGKDKKFFFTLDAELIVYGRTDPAAQVSLQGETIKLRPDGSFTMRYSLPDSRQIIPAVSSSADGSEERTIVLAVERNTKQLEPLLHEGYD